jgi:hypothetical protein
MRISRSVAFIVVVAMWSAGCGGGAVDVTTAAATAPGSAIAPPATTDATTAGATKSGVTSTSATTTVPTRLECPITLPPVPGLAVPGPYPEQPSQGVWYGSAELWTVLEPDGTYIPRKGVFWSADFGGGDVEEKPDLAVTWRRLDRELPVVTAGSPGTNAYTPEDGWFMMAGIDPDDSGCWEVTATYRGATLSYVYLKP